MNQKAFSLLYIQSYVGLARRKLWGYVGILTTNGISDALIAIFDADQRTLVGLLIVVAVIVYLTRSRIRHLFD